MANRIDHPNAGEFAREFADDLRVLMYGDCDMAEQIKRLASTLAKYDGVAADWDSNKLLTEVLLPKVR